MSPLLHGSPPVQTQCKHQAHWAVVPATGPCWFPHPPQLPGKLPAVTQLGSALTSLVKLPQMCSSLSGTPLSQPGTPALQGTILHRSGIALPAAPSAPQDWGSRDKGELSGNWRSSAMRAREGLQDSAAWGPEGWGGAGALANTHTAPARPWPCRVEPEPGLACLRFLLPQSLLSRPPTQS